MSKPVTQDESVPGGEAIDTYDDTAVFLSGELRNHSNYTLGNLLTAVEALLGEGRQAEAFKSIVRREMHYMIDRNQAEVYVRAKMQRTGLEPKEIHEFKDKDGKYEATTVRQVEES